MKKGFISILTFIVSLALATMSFAADEMTKKRAVTAKPNLISADRLIGMDLENLQGEELGEITDVILDERTGRVAYLLVSEDELWDMGDERRIIPFSAVSRQGDQLVIDMTEEKLATAPRWEAGSEQAQYESELHEFFGGAPYWEAPSELEEPMETKPTRSGPAAE